MLLQLRSYLNENVVAPVEKTEINGRGNLLRWPRYTLYPQRLALTSLISGGRSVGIVRLQTTATEFMLCCYPLLNYFPRNKVEHTLAFILNSTRNCSVRNNFMFNFSVSNSKCSTWNLLSNVLMTCTIISSNCYSSEIVTGYSLIFDNA
jgi:hypothetical protein